MDEGNDYQVWRLDDNGNRFKVGRPVAKQEAMAVVRHFESLHHKQTYWVEQAKAKD